MRYNYSTEHRYTHSRLLRLEKMTQNIGFRLGLLGVVIAGTFVYVFQINMVTGSGYRVAQMKRHIAELQVENRQLDVQIAEASSIDHLNTMLAERGYVTVGHAEYASVAVAHVAVR